MTIEANPDGVQENSVAQAIIEVRGDGFLKELSDLGMNGQAQYFGLTDGLPIDLPSIVKSPGKRPSRAPRMSGESLDFVVAYLQNEIGIGEERAVTLAKGFSYRPLETILGTISTLEALGPKYKTIIKANPRMICHPAPYIKRIVRGVHLASQMLNWEGNSDELPVYSHRFIMSSEQRLRIHARIFAKYAEPEISASTISNLIGLPLNAHFVTIGLGERYTLFNVRNAKLAFSSSERDEIATKSIVTHPELFGDKLIKAYREYCLKRES